jgi:hypothetical protein
MGSRYAQTHSSGTRNSRFSVGLNTTACQTCLPIGWLVPKSAIAAAVTHTNAACRASVCWSWAVVTAFQAPCACWLEQLSTSRCGDKSVFSSATQSSSKQPEDHE